MRDIPIIFAAPMVRALIEGRKTMTRRLAHRWAKNRTIRLASVWHAVKPGDRLYVRENFTLVGGGDPGLPVFAANWREDCRARGFDNIPDTVPKWKPCIHMPRWASRLTLIVADVKTERLQNISERDAIQEGLINIADHTYPIWTAGDGFKEHPEWPLDAFAELWQAIHGQKSWDDNPEVVALTFSVHKCNVDRMPQ